ncbi:protein phosphatase 1B-like isoform X2 [Apostichopus japonicus]|uniref:protein phosphatase 1B-like isoform X2 n=1 Tax=Stichopus japonicus TaxID=307972 RepID=UPI003AB270AB
MGAFLDKPKIEKESSSGTGNSLRYGVSSMQGWRVEMEDAHSTVIGLPGGGLSGWSFFSVYDGHAGSKVARYCSENLLPEIISKLDLDEDAGSPPPPTVESVKQGIRNGFLSIDQKMKDKFTDDKSGTTVVGVIISPTHLFFINCGDSRGILVRDNGVEFHTDDHKPSKPVERDRIHKAGGTVMISRVNGSLAVSRALGDYEYKNAPDRNATEQLVSPEPEVTVMERSAKDEFIVLACDGVWDVMSNEATFEFIQSRLQLTDDLEEVCNQVIDTSLHKGSRDNMSIVLVTLQSAPKISDDALDRERNLDSRIEGKIKEILETFDEQVNVDLVMQILANCNLEGLPPGGGISAKKSKVDEILTNLIPERKKEYEEMQ